MRAKDMRPIAFNAEDGLAQSSAEATVAGGCGCALCDRGEIDVVGRALVQKAVKQNEPSETHWIL